MTLREYDRWKNGVGLRLSFLSRTRSRRRHSLPFSLRFVRPLAVHLVSRTLVGNAMRLLLFVLLTTMTSHTAPQYWELETLVQPQLGRRPSRLRRTSTMAPESFNRSITARKFTIAVPPKKREWNFPFRRSTTAGLATQGAKRAAAALRELITQGKRCWLPFLRPP